MTVSGCCGGHVVEVAGKRPIGPSKPARLGTLGRSKSRTGEREGVVGEADRAGAIEATPAARGIDGGRRTGDVLRRTTASPGPFSDCRQDGGKGSVGGCLKQDARAKYSNNSSGAPKPKGSCVSKNGAAGKGKKATVDFGATLTLRAAGSHSHSVHIHIHTPPSSRPPVKTMQPAEGPETLALWDGHFWTVPARDIEPGTRWRELLQGKWQWRVGV